MTGQRRAEGGKKREKECHLEAELAEEPLVLAALGHLLLAHLLRHLQGVPVDAGDEGVSVGLVRATFIVVLDNDGFASGEAAVQHQHHLALLQEFTHLRRMKVSRELFQSLLISNASLVSFYQKKNYFKQIETTQL